MRMLQEKFLRRFQITKTAELLQKILVVVEKCVLQAIFMFCITLRKPKSPYKGRVICFSALYTDLKNTTEQVMNHWTMGIPHICHPLIYCAKETVHSTSSILENAAPKRLRPFNLKQ